MKNTKEEGKIELAKERTKKISIQEGSATSIMSGAGDSYIVPFALALNANNAQIGFLTSFVSLFGAASQIFGGKLLYKYTTRRIILATVFLQATMWVAILGLGILVLKGVINGYAAGILIVFYIIYAIFSGLGNPPWFNLMGDIVKEGERDRYFSRRNRITAFIALLTTLLAAFILDYFKDLGIVLWGFVIIFSVAALGRYFATYLFTKHYYPKREFKKEKYFSFFQFVKKAPQTNFGRFSIFLGLVNLATNFAAPFFAVYMLKELNFSYTLFIIVAFSSVVFTIFSMPVWGKIGDKYGNRYLMKIGGIMIPFAALFWLVSKNPLVLIFTAQLAAGIGWAAFNLGASNFIYDAVSPQRRAICVAYYSTISGIGVFIGAIAGGLFAQYVHVNFMNTFLLIFLISGFLRALVIFSFLPEIKEVRKVQDSKNINLIKYFAHEMPKPLYGLFRGVFFVANDFMSIGKGVTKK
ncbi:MAG: MFS transporter [Nanoarchaeota archaeon]